MHQSSPGTKALTVRRYAMKPPSQEGDHHGTKCAGFAADAVPGEAFDAVCLSSILAMDNHAIVGLVSMNTVG